VALRNGGHGNLRHTRSVGWPRPLRRRGRDDFPARLSGAADATGLARHHPVIAGRVDERFIIQALTAITFVTNIVGHATDAVSDEVQLRVIAYWARVDAHLGAQVAAGLGDGNGGTGGHSPRRWPRSSAGRASRA
jgi:Catalase-related immune-responsive